ncbi:hypothetical protein I6F35_10090 [Bradyrhizobium sp. BRP22]|uniref:hypothetical protein n=1 Tax=Bradyrhizobium sp. BRP22 TaxID=2793821 RepID=UPI001CD2CC1F|nr:hypothetical protein [Bradyrhizobium sp. BRP22]MCA1453562.1 hypothetical protein [Bradyrhizobium sp. BRP22]
MSRVIDFNCYSRGHSTRVNGSPRNVADRCAILGKKSKAASRSRSYRQKTPLVKGTFERARALEANERPRRRNTCGNKKARTQTKAWDVLFARVVVAGDKNLAMRAHESSVLTNASERVALLDNGFARLMHPLPQKAGGADGSFGAHVPWMEPKARERIADLPLPRHLRTVVMTYVDLLVSFIFLLLIYLVFEVNALRELILYSLEPPRDGNFDDGHPSG